MLFCNEKLIDVTKKDDPAVNFYLKARNEIMSRKDIVVVRQIREDLDSKIYYDNNKQRLQAVPVSLNCKTQLSSERGVELWRFATSTSVRGNGVIDYSPKAWIIFEQMELDPVVNIEEIFFILYVMGENKLKSYGLYVNDPIRKAKQKISQYSGDELDVNYMIFRNRELTDEDIRVISLAWGITDAYSKNIDVLRVQLYELVMEKHRQNPLNNIVLREFIKDCQNFNHTEIKALINKAVSENNIFDFEQSTARWFYKNTKEYICRVPIDKIQDRNIFLANHFMKPEKKEELNAIKLEVWSEKVKPEYSIYDIEKFNTIQELRKVAKEYGKMLPIALKDFSKAKQWIIDNCISAV